MGIIDKISALVSRHTAFTLLLTLALSALALTAIVDPLTGQMRLIIDPSANRLFSENQSAKQYYDKTRQLFGSDETLIITVASDDVFTVGSFDTINRITTRIEALPAVHHVVSLANAVDIRTVDGGLDISPFSMALEDGSASPEDIKQRVLGNPLYAGNLVSEAADATAVVVYFNNISDRDYISGGTHEDITRIVEEEQGSNEIFMTGSPYFKVAMVDLLVDDLIWTPPLITVIIAIVLAFRVSHPDRHYCAVTHRRCRRYSDPRHHFGTWLLAQHDFSAGTATADDPRTFLRRPCDLRVPPAAAQAGS